MIQTSEPDGKTPLWRDDRVLRVVIQVGIVGAVLLFGGLLVGTMNRNLAQLGRQWDFGFLQNQAGFNIGETIVPYTTNDPYFWALLVGWLNTLRLILVGFGLATAIGLLAGIASFSDNWLLRQLNQIYVEVVRNVPLLLQLFFWIFVVFYGIAPQQIDQPPAAFLGVGYISKKGMVVPWGTNWLGWGAFLAGAIAAYLLWRRRIYLLKTQGQSENQPPPWRSPASLTGVLVAIAIVELWVFVFGLGWQVPALNADGSEVVGGLRLSLEYAAALLGLSVYTGAFIAEIVRAGIQSVPKGQWEAAAALGFSKGRILQFIVLPQALRFIIPSLNSQYQNLAKNSTLALTIGYPDFFSTFQTTQNQTGRAAEMISILMAIYLALNLIITLVMNQLNRSVQFKER